MQSWSWLLLSLPKEVGVAEPSICALSDAFDRNVDVGTCSRSILSPTAGRSQVVALHVGTCPSLAPFSVSASNNRCDGCCSIHTCSHLFKMVFSLSRQFISRTSQHRSSPAVIFLPSQASSGHVSDPRYAEQEFCVYPKGWQQLSELQTSIPWQGRKCLGVCLCIFFCGPLVQR